MKLQFVGKKIENVNIEDIDDNRSSIQKIADLLINNALYFMTAILVLVVALRYPLFIKNAPLDLLKCTAAYVIIALGMGGIIVISGVDLSAGRIMGFTALIAASLLQRVDAPLRILLISKPWPIPLVLLIVIAIGTVIGAFNGFFIAKFYLYPYIVTLSTQVIIYGAMLLYINIPHTSSGHKISFLTEAYTNFITHTVNIGSWSIPNYVWYSVILIVVMWFVWNKTKLGRNMFALGTNREITKASGVDVFGTIVAVFAMAGALYAINGFIEAARIGGPGVSAGNNIELDSIVSCVLGGVSFVGGKGKIGGIVVGVVLFQLIMLCLMWLMVPATYFYIIKGAILLLAIALDMRKHRAIVH